MSWFTKKKVVEDDEKDSSVLTIETMHEDLEESSNTQNDKKNDKKETEKKPEKTSPFLMGNSSEGKNITELKPKEEKSVEIKKDELSTQKPAIELADEAGHIPEEDTSVTKNTKSIDITKNKEEKEITHEESIFKSLIKKEKSLTEAIKKEEKPLEESDEDKMEKIVKSANFTSETKKEPVETNSTISTPDKNTEEAVYIDRTRQNKAAAKESVEKEDDGKLLINGKLVSTKRQETTSPFGVPKKGISVAGVNKIANGNDKNISTTTRNFNKPLLLLAIIVFILTIVAVGANYYRNSQKEPSPATPSMVTENNLEDIAYTKDNFAGTGIVLKTSKELLLSDLKAFVKKEQAINPAKFIGGQFIRPLQKETEYITGEEILSIFGSKDPAINSFLDKPAMLFVTEESIEVEDPATTPSSGIKTNPTITTKNVIKVALILELKKDTEPGDVIERLTEIETTFPGTLKGLMIEEDIKIANEKIVFNQASPEKKDFVHTIRYYNFKYGNVTRSIEWGSLLYKNKSYIFFSTSKEATNSLIKALY